MNTVDTLAAYISSLPGTISESALCRAEDCILDALGAAATGLEAESTRIVRSIARRILGSGNSTVWYAGDGYSAVAAAYANSMAASAADVDDGHRLALGHPGAAVIPTALAVGEETGASGKKVLEAVIAGYEAAVRFAKARKMSVHRSTATGRWAGVGVVAAIARLREFHPIQFRDAMLIAEQQGPGLLSADLHGFGGSHVKEGIAWSVVSGFFAAELSAGGFRPYPRTLDIEELYDAGAVVSDFGNPLMIEQTFFKPYAVCRWIHCALDAFRALLDEVNPVSSRIQRIDVKTFERAVRLANDPDPPDVEAAQFSLPFAIGVVATAGADHLLPLNRDLIGNPDVSAFARLVHLAVDSQCEAAFPARTVAVVDIQTESGRHTRRVEYPLGDPANPMDRSMLQDKFRRLAVGVLDAENRKRLIEAVAELRRADLASVLTWLRNPIK